MTHIIRETTADLESVIQNDSESVSRFLGPKVDLVLLHCVVDLCSSLVQSLIEFSIVITTEQELKTTDKLEIYLLYTGNVQG